MSKLCLGTVQFGMDYGLHGRKKPEQDKCLEMLDFASEHIEYVDTAFAYKSESVVGLRSGNFRIITKVPPQKLIPNSDILAECKSSCGRLNIKSLNAYLFHTPKDVYDKDRVSQLQSCKDEGLTDNIGASVYDVEEGLKAIELGFDYIQIPYSVLDRRFEANSFFERAADKNVVVFARSAFVQGLLTGSTVPNWLSDAKPYLDIFNEISERYGLSKAEVALLFSLTQPSIHYTVFGVHDMEQLKENINTYEGVYDFETCRHELADRLKDVPKPVVVPSLWKR